MSASNTQLVSWIDCPGGGQVWVDGTTLYVAHMNAPAGTSIYDIADPRQPKLLAHLEMPAGWHSHKVRVANGLMIVNHERQGRDGDAAFGGGIAIYDVSRPSAPRLLHKWRTGGTGVHRSSFDGRYAYLSPTADGFRGNIVLILDLLDPTRPVEVSRWWIPGQNAGAHEDYPWEATYPQPRCHHPLRVGNRLYVSYWHHGFFILDISDMASPKLISEFNTSPAHPHPTHTCLVFPEPIRGRTIMVVADEDVSKLRPSPPAFSWLYDITDETQPVPIATFDIDIDPDGAPQDTFTGCHQPSEVFTQPIVPFAWFAHGLRIMDASDPFRPREVGFFKPEPPAGQTRLSSNDVTQDDRGLIYLTDRVRGVHIIERTA